MTAVVDIDLGLCLATGSRDATTGRPSSRPAPRRRSKGSSHLPPGENARARPWWASSSPRRAPRGACPSSCAAPSENGSSQVRPTTKRGSPRSWTAPTPRRDAPARTSSSLSTICRLAATLLHHPTCAGTDQRTGSAHSPGRELTAAVWLRVPDPAGSDGCGSSSRRPASRCPPTVRGALHHADDAVVGFSFCTGAAMAGVGADSRISGFAHSGVSCLTWSPHRPGLLRVGEQIVDAVLLALLARRRLARLLGREHVDSAPCRPVEPLLLPRLHLPSAAVDELVVGRLQRAAAASAAAAVSSFGETSVCCGFALPSPGPSSGSVGSATSPPRLCVVGRLSRRLPFPSPRARRSRPSRLGLLGGGLVDRLRLPDLVELGLLVVGPHHFVFPLQRLADAGLVLGRVVGFFFPLPSDRRLRDQ